MNVLRISLSNNDAEWRAFPKLFEVFWGAPEQEEPEETQRPERSPEESGPDPERGTEVHRSRSEGAAPEGETPCPEKAAYSAVSTLGRKDLGELDRAEVESARLALKRIASLFDLERSRRRKRSRRPAGLDFSRTLRECLRTGGLPLDLRYRDRKQRLRRLVILADVSGSMDRYARLVLPFLLGIRGVGSRAEVFVFSTTLACITRTVRRLPMEEVLDHLAGNVPGWSGGTRIGASLRQFNQTESGRKVDRRTVVLIFSDGWDLGAGEVLHTEMASLKRKAHRVIWLNPLAGDPHFQPLCAGMAAALPHIDHLLPASDLNNLWRAGDLLSRVMSKQPLRTGHANSRISLP